MTDHSPQLPPRLQSIVDDFEQAEGRDKLELLLDFSAQMPPLPEHIAAQRESFDSVPECMTPVFVYAETTDGRLYFYFDVPPESPTVRGYAALMAEGLAGATPEQVLAIPGDFFNAMGLQQVISYQRIKGISAILAHMKRLAMQAITPEV